MIGKLLFNIFKEYFRQTLISDKPSSVINGKVVRVVDGDTFRMIPYGSVPPGVKINFDGSVPVRIYGFDAPELYESFGTSAKQSLYELIWDREVEIHIKAIDKYGRIVASVYCDGINVGVEQKSRGYSK